MARVVISTGEPIQIGHYLGKRKPVELNPGKYDLFLSLKRDDFLVLMCRGHAHHGMTKKNWLLSKRATVISGNWFWSRIETASYVTIRFLVYVSFTYKRQVK